MLTIRLLGEVEVARGTERLTLPQSRKTRALLAYLVATGRPHRRERLCSLVWEVPDDPRGALRWSLSKLRALVDEPGRTRLVADRESVAFAGEGADVDLTALRELTARPLDAAPVDRLRAVADCIRGEFLEGLDLTGQPDFQAWCVAEREEACRRHAAVLGVLAARLSETPDEALPYARRLVQLEPFDERARVALVGLLARAGRRGEAEQHCDAGMRRLREAGMPCGHLARLSRDLRDAALRRPAPPPRDKAGATWDQDLRHWPEPADDDRPDALGARPVSAEVPSPVLPDGATAERKHVTILVAAITELPARPGDDDGLDPELSMRRLDPCLEAIRDAIRRHEGSVTAAPADGVTAVFGAPVAHEDDAIRACLAALAMRDAARRWPELALRVGLHTGEVVVRPAGDPQHPGGIEAVGPVVRLAGRVAAAVGPGAVALTAATARRAEGFVTVAPLGDDARPGGEPARRHYTLVGWTAPRSRWDVRAARGLTRLVGRDAELGSLRRAMQRAGSGRGEIVAVVGDPGVGKSRLAHEFLRAAVPPGWAVLETSAAPHDAHAAYLPVGNLLRSWLGVEERDTRDEIARKIQHTVDTVHPGLLDHRPALSSLLDLPGEDASWQGLSPGQRRRATLDAIKAVLVLESRRQPLVLLLEDLHWVDAQTQEALDALVDGLGALRILVVATHRPEYRHGWGGKGYFSQVRLDPLPADTAEELLRSLLGAAAELDALRRALAARTEGVPLFLEEAVRALLDTGALTGAPGRYRLATPAVAAAAPELPATVQAVLAARIDRLPPRCKALLQTASVIGRDVPFALLRRVAGLPEGELLEGLAELQAAEFLFETRLPPDLEHTFKHALTREVAYGGVLHERRRAMHVELVRTIEDSYRDRLDEQVDRLAHHALAGEVWDRAARYLLQAAGRAIQRSAHLQAADLLSRGLEAVGRLAGTPEHLRTELELQKAMGVTMMAAKGWSAQEVSDAYARAGAICEQLGDERELFAVLRGRGQFHMIRGELRAACALGDRCAHLAASSADPGMAIETHHLFWSTRFFMGDYAEAGTHARHGMALYDRDRDHRLTYVYSGHDPGVCCRSFSGLVLWQEGYPDRALARCREALSLAEEVSHPLTLALAQWALSYVHLLRREPAPAREWAEREIAVCEEYLLPLLLPQGMFQLGWAVAEQGGLDAGIAGMREGLAAMGATQMGLPFFVALLGEAHAKAGRPEEGLLEIERALATVERNGGRFQLPEILRLKGELLRLRPGRPDDGAVEASLGDALAAARAQGARLPELRAAVSLARLRHGRGDRAAAHRILSPVYDRFTEGFDTLDLREARALLDGCR